MRAFALLALAVMLEAGACRAAVPQPAATALPPRLVVLIAIDGFPQRQFVDYREQLAPDGFRRFLDRGAWFADAHFGHSYTVTGPGHATMVTGAYANRHGIIGNEWRDRATGEPVYCAGDPAHTYIGHRTEKLDGTSPRNLKVETVGDVLRRAAPAAKVIAISIKDRSAILLAGKEGTAYMYQWQTGQFASTTYYMKEHPGWVAQFHAVKPADRYFLAEWRPLLEAPAYAASVADEQGWYAKGGKLPKKIGEGMAAPAPAFYSALVASPFSDQLTLDFARAAVAAEALGQDEAPDILALSLSGHDSVNHGYGAESRLSHDHVLHLDRSLQAFFRDLDEKVGKDRYLLALTADHGFTPAPELSAALGRQAARFNMREALARIDAELARRHGGGKWLLGVSADALLVNRALAREKGVDADKLVEDARRVFAAEPAVAAAYTRAELESVSRAGAPYFPQMLRSFDRERSGDVQFVLKPYHVPSWGSRSGTTHGSPHAYDTHVPIAFYGPRWIKPGRHDGPVEVIDIAPTLARILGVAPPSASEGKVLPILAKP